jgi:hypothetical protein
MAPTPERKLLQADDVGVVGRDQAYLLLEVVVPVVRRGHAVVEVPGAYEQAHRASLRERPAAAACSGALSKRDALNRHEAATYLSAFPRYRERR